MFSLIDLIFVALRWIEIDFRRQTTQDYIKNILKKKRLGYLKQVTLTGDLEPTTYLPPSRNILKLCVIIKVSVCYTTSDYWNRLFENDPDFGNEFEPKELSSRIIRWIKTVKVVSCCVLCNPKTLEIAIIKFVQKYGLYCSSSPSTQVHSCKYDFKLLQPS